ncbi:Lar family restriction alleviation protein [Burkholderia cenocepacia]|uniref:Lar family restriction alleviation protein n=1 Tax=Burkholderia cenocepacia TaxID=95486 RepID=UPI002AB73418|nr:Lar family restriction alleviation protein [Burkholderia cenocepacia]
MTTENSRADALTEPFPCPFCGSDEVTVGSFGSSYIDPQHYVQCEQCDGATVRHASDGEAIAAWNRRTPASQPAAAPIDEPTNPYAHQGSLGEAWRKGFTGGRPLAAPGSAYMQAYDEGKAARAATPAPSPADERAAFEAHMRKHGAQDRDLRVRHLDTERYHLDVVQAAWEGWQARGASANETGAEGATLSQSDEMRRMVREIALKYCGYDKGGEYNVLRYECDEDFFNFVHEAAIALSRSPAMAAEAVAIPAGYALVPVEPTEKMINEGACAQSLPGPHYISESAAKQCWRNMLAAATQPAQASGIVEAIAAQWDGCTYTSPGEDIDIGAAIRDAWKRLSGTPAQADARVDVEAMLRACVPGGDICDPQRIADSIREWFDEHGQNAAQAAILTREEIGEAWRQGGSVGVEMALRSAAAQADARVGLTDAVVDPAKTVVREALDSVSVHPCDERDEEVRARQLPDHMQRLYRALLQGANQ